MLLLVLAIAAVAWLQQAQSASAIPQTVSKDYQGTVNVRVKNGAAWQVFPMQVCVTVETNGPNGDITDVYMAGSDTSQCTEDVPALTIDPPPSNTCLCELGTTPGSFLIDTTVDQASTGFGWKTSPTKQTASQWQFKLISSTPGAADIFLNNGARMMTPNTLLTVKFIRDRGGIYFKATGFAPLNANGLPKVQIEIESTGAGLDAPPTVVDVTPVSGSDGDSDTTPTFTYDEPVNVEPSAAGIECIFEGNTVAFNTANANLTILGQGTKVITLVPTGGLPLNGNWVCTAFIDSQGVDDVDTIDPPSNWFFSGASTEFFTGQGS